jgi:hypothetical protein
MEPRHAAAGPRAGIESDTRPYGFCSSLADVVSFIYGAEMQVAPESRLSWMLE